MADDESPTLDDVEQLAERRFAALAATTSTYKVLGEVDDPGASGVYGYNSAASGNSTGVHGVTDAVDPNAAGVRGRSTATTGDAIGVSGFSGSTSTGAAGVRGDANFGVGVFGYSQGFFGLVGLTGYGGSAGIYGLNQGTDAPNNSGAGVQGLTETSGLGSAGVFGHATMSSGETYGVNGVTESSAHGAAGVFGEARQTSGRTFGVNGRTSSARTGAAGVAGIATNDTGTAYGVRGESQSTDDLATGVYARSPNGRGVWANSTDGIGVFAASETGRGIQANSAESEGILGLTFDDSSAGVEGQATQGTGVTYGVRGTNQSLDSGATGVHGQTFAGSGQTYGVEGVSRSVEAGAAGVRGTASATSGSGAGVEGVAQGGGSGVVGRATNPNASNPEGVLGTTDSPGEIYYTLSLRFFSAGVRGNATSDGALASAGVMGTSQATSGAGHGVYGETGSASDYAAGVKGESFSTATGVVAQSTSGTGVSVVGASQSSNTSPLPDEHAATIEDTAQTNSSVLAVQAGFSASDTAAAHNFLTFFDGIGTPVGTIENDGSSGVALASGGSDYAEWLPKREPGTSLDPGTVVGVVDGEVTTEAENGNRAMVVTDQAIVTGNDPGPEPGARAGYVPVAFVGQVPVRVRGSVDEGDVVVAAGEGEATAVEAWSPGDGPIVGRAWAGSDHDGVELVTVAVGLETGEVLSSVVDEQADRIDALESRLRRVERHVGMGAASADD